MTSAGPLRRSPWKAAMLRRRTALLLLPLAALLCLGSPAQAAGTGDVELIPASVGGEPQTAFRIDDGQDSLRFELVNLVDEPRTAKLYAASATRSGSGAIAVGADGSAPWLELPLAEVELGPQESRTFTAPLALGELESGQQQLGAVVLEARQGSVTVRVATLVTVDARDDLPLPLWTVAVAGGAIVLVLVGLFVARRRKDDEDEPVVAPEPVLVGPRRA